MIVVVAAFVFAAVVTLIVTVWSFWSYRGRMRARLTTPVSEARAPDLLRADAKTAPSGWERVARRSTMVSQIAALSEQAGMRWSATNVLVALGVLALLGGAAGWWRTANPGGALLGAIGAASLPVLYLVQKRNRRRKRFEEQFADAVDMMARSIRAGNALTGAIQLVGEESAEPVQTEFRKVSEEIRLGLDPGEALERLQRRIPTEDVVFFCAAVNIQRGSGGNLAEVLDRLSEVIRKRFELLSHARVLSAQQRYAAVFVGLSPFAFSVLFYFVSPGYFDPLIKSPSAPLLIGAGLLLELVGFAVIWRLAQIKV